MTIFEGQLQILAALPARRACFASVERGSLRFRATPWGRADLARDVPLGVRTEPGGPASQRRRHVVRDLFLRLVREDEGQDLIEYALLAGFISLVAVVAITNVGTGVNTVYGNVQGQVAAIPGGGS